MSVFIIVVITTGIIIIMAIIGKVIAWSRNFITFTHFASFLFPNPCPYSSLSIYHFFAVIEDAIVIKVVNGVVLVIEVIIYCTLDLIIPHSFIGPITTFTLVKDLINYVQCLISA